MLEDSAVMFRCPWFLLDDVEAIGAPNSVGMLDIRAMRYEGYLTA